MSTSKLQRRVSELLSVHLGRYIIREDYRPDWLSTQCGRLELDFYIEELKTAIEVQGSQHYIYTPFFHGDEKGFAAQLERDIAKRQECERHNIRLVEIDTYEKALETILSLADKEHKYPIHHNTILAIVGTRSPGQLDCKQYPKTLARHLKRIHKMLSRAKDRGWMEANEARMIRISLTAIRQHKKAKGISVAGMEQKLLDTAQQVVDSCSVHAVGVLPEEDQEYR